MGCRLTSGFVSFLAASFSATIFAMHAQIEPWVSLRRHDFPVRGSVRYLNPAFFNEIVQLLSDTPVSSTIFINHRFSGSDTYIS